MNLFEELQRIAETLDNKHDAEILKIASIQLIPKPKPKHENVTEIPGYGYHISRSY